MQEKAIIGLAPVDGVTDAAFRKIVDEVGKPDIMFTEFAPTEGLYRGRTVLLNAFKKHTSETPIVAQFFGGDPRYFYYAFFIAAALGYDGVDVNMGCPDSSIVKKGGGAGLLLDLPRAGLIIQTIHTAQSEWKNGKTLYDTDINEEMKLAVRAMSGSAQNRNKRLTVSVKIRIGYDESQMPEAIKTLLEFHLDRISIHGRTFKQRYSGLADWDEIAKAVQAAKGSGTKIFGNGDIHSLSDAHKKIVDYGVDGVLIARAAFGNPWIFADTHPAPQERFAMMLHHARLFLEYRPELDLKPMRKHFAWYCKGLENAANLRSQLMNVTTLEDLQKILPL